MNILMKILRERRVAIVAISAILLCVLYDGYRIYESKSDAALVHEQTLERRRPHRGRRPMAKPMAADRDHYASRQYRGLV